MPYIPHTPDDVRAMLDAIGADSIEDLFDEIPAHLKAAGKLDARRRYGRLPLAVSSTPPTRPTRRKRARAPCR